jgi:outer membrane protein assembly factor BamB
LGGFENMFGYAESPLVSGDTLFCTPGGLVNNVVALNRFTGQLFWSSKATGDTTSFCSPILINLPKAKVFVNIARHHIYGLDATNGKLLWKQHLAGFRYEGEHCNTPVYNNGFLYYTTADENGNGTVCLKISEDGKSISEIWRNKEVGGAFGGMVLLENLLFLTTSGKKLIAYDVSDGKEVAVLKPCKGGLIYAGNKFYCNDENGQMKLIGFNGNTFVENGKFKIPKGNKEHFSHPVISDGTLFIRHGKALMAYDIKL